MKKDMTRREFVGKGAATLGAAALLGCGDDPNTAQAPPAEDALTSDAGTGAEDTGATGGSELPGETPDVPIEPPVGTGSVGVVRRKDLEEGVRIALEHAGGLGMIAEGQTVFIKPNAVHPAALQPGITTSTDILAVVIKLVKERKPGKIIVGDRSARFFASDFVFGALGLEEAADEAGADEVDEAAKPVDAPEDWVLVQPEGWEETWLEAGGVLAMKKLIEADHVINLAVCKNHRWAGFSLALKNFIGGIGDDSRDPMHYKEGDPDALSRDIAILNGAFTTTMNIVDARAVLMNGGPEGVDDDAVFTDAGIIMASTDRIAIDAVGAALIQLELSRHEITKPDAVYEIMISTPTWMLPQLVHAQSLGLGDATKATLDVTYDGLDDDEALLKERLLA